MIAIVDDDPAVLNSLARLLRPAHSQLRHTSQGDNFSTLYPTGNRIA